MIGIGKPHLTQQMPFILTRNKIMEAAANKATNGGWRNNESWKTHCRFYEK